MVFIPGLHKEYIEHELDASDRQNFDILIAREHEPGYSDEVVVDLEPDAGVFFHSQLLYRTDPNTTEGPGAYSRCTARAVSTQFKANSLGR